MNLREFKPSDRPILTVFAADDHHDVLAPTHVFEKDNRIVGYLSIDGVPCVNIWLDSKRVKALDSVRALSQIREKIHGRGFTQFVMPCCTESPFFPHMERLGFRPSGFATLFTSQ